MTRASVEAFVVACERDDIHFIRSLLRAIDVVYQEALRFFRRKCGAGQKAIDVSSFFKRYNLHSEFANFWRESGNKSRTKFQKAAWLKVEKIIRRKVAE